MFCLKSQLIKLYCYGFFPVYILSGFQSVGCCLADNILCDDTDYLSHIMDDNDECVMQEEDE